MIVDVEIEDVSKPNIIIKRENLNEEVGQDISFDLDIGGSSSESSSDDEDLNWSSYSENYKPKKLEYFPPIIYCEKLQNPIEYFIKFFDNEVISYMCEETNRYSEHIKSCQKEHLENHPNSRVNEFSPITNNEMCAFIASMIYMGIHKLDDQYGNLVYNIRSLVK